MTNLEIAQRQVKDAQDLLQEANLNLERAQRPETVGDRIAEIFNEGNYYQATVLEENRDDSVYLHIKGCTNNGEIRARSILGQVLNQTGYFVGCSVKRSLGIELRFFKQWLL